MTFWKCLARSCLFAASWLGATSCPFATSWLGGASLVWAQPASSASDAGVVDLWSQPGHQLVPLVSKVTDSSGQPHPVLMFFLRNEQGQGVGVGLPGSPSLRTFFRHQADRELQRIVQQRHLSPQQLQKLQAAATLDVARLMRRISQIDRQVSRLDYDSQIAIAHDLLSPLQKICSQGLFTDHSLLKRLLATLPPTSPPPQT